MVLFLLSQNWLPRPRAEDKDRSRTHNLKRAANSWRLWTPPEGFNPMDLQVQLLPAICSQLYWSQASPDPSHSPTPKQVEDWGERRKERLIVVSHPWRVESSDIFREDRGALSDIGGIRNKSKWSSWSTGLHWLMKQTLLICLLSERVSARGSFYISAPQERRKVPTKGGGKE